MEAGLEWRSCRQVHDGNAQPQGFGHIGFIVDNLQAIEILPQSWASILWHAPLPGLPGLGFRVFGFVV